jgi:chromosome segregation ATPase
MERAQLSAEREVLQSDNAKLVAQGESLALERQTELESLAAERRALEDRWNQLKSRESNASELQQRLADQSEEIREARAELVSRQEALAHQQAQLENSSRKLADETESLKRQRTELSARAAELAEQRERLNADRNRLQETQSQMTDVTQALLLERSNLAQLREEQKRRKFEIMTEARTPPLEFDCVQDRTPASRCVDDDPLELTRHNKVFRTERAGSTLLVTPLGDSSQFLYSDVRTEANKVRRLLEAGSFLNLVVDFGSAASFDTIMLKVVVSLAQIVSNRGGRAALCRASEKTRANLKTMRLLDLWPLFLERSEALRGIAGNDTK